MFLCLYLTKKNLSEKRIISIFWIFSSYVAFLFIIEGVINKTSYTLGFSGVSWRIETKDQVKSILFVLISNVLFFIGSAIRLFKSLELKKYTRKSNFTTKPITVFYSIVFLLSYSVYLLKMQGLGYAGFVEYSGSDWSRVFLIYSVPIILLSYVRKNYIICFSAVLMIIYVAFYLQIRSFFILTLVPLLILIWLLNDSENRIDKKYKLAFLSILSISLGISTLISLQKTGVIILPESGLPKNYFLVFDKITYGALNTGFNSLNGFFEGLFLPFFNILGGRTFISASDTPVYMASLIFDTDSFTDSFYHFPSLWYADSYVSFGIYGILLSFFWGWLIGTVDELVSKNIYTLVFFLPYATWFIIIIFRGAIANSTIAISLPFYLQIVTFTFIYISNKSIRKYN